MLSKLLFGVQNSPQRKIMVGLAIVLVLIGLAYIPMRAPDDGIGAVLTGLAFIALGLITIAVVARLFAARDERVATTEQLNRLPGRYNDYALKSMVEKAPHDPNQKLGSVTGQLDADEIQAAVEQVRGDAADT